MPPPNWPGQSLLDVVVDVHQVGAAGHRLGLELDLLHVGQALQALLGALDRRVGQPAAFELAHFAAQRLVVDGGRIVEIDVPHVHPVAGLDEEGDRHGLLLVVGRRHRIDLGECVAVRAQPVAHQFLRVGDRLAREDVARVDLQQLAQLRLRHHHRAGELDLRHPEYVALADVDGDVHVVLLRRDGHLGGLDLEIGIAAVHIVGTQLLQIAGQGFARIAVVLLVPGHPVRRLQLEGLEHVLFLELGVADEVDHLDLGALALVDVDHDVDLVARQISDLRVDAHGVLAAAEVLVGEILLDLIEHRSIEGLALREADVAQTLLQILGLDVLVALDLELGDRGPLDHHDEQRIAVAAQFDVAEETRGVQGAHRLGDALLIETVADVHRQVVEHRAFRYSLQSFDADVADDEGAARCRRLLGLRRGRLGSDGLRGRLCGCG